MLFDSLACHCGLCLLSQIHAAHTVIHDHLLPLQRFFSKWEFQAPYLLCCSDCEPLTMQQLLAAADQDSLERCALTAILVSLYNSLKGGSSTPEVLSSSKGAYGRCMMYKCAFNGVLLPMAS